jgi:hypothetical protein
MAKNGNIHPKRIFKEPKDLEKAWNEYKNSLEAESKKWLKVQYVGKEGQRVTDAQKLPYTMDGFEIFCHNHYGTVNNYFDNKDGYYEDFYTICSRIRTEIRNDQITGGLLGFYNPSITQRLNGLADKTESTIKHEQPLFPEE